MRRSIIIVVSAVVAIVLVGTGIIYSVNRNRNLQNIVLHVANLNTNNNLNVNVANTNSATNSPQSKDREAITFVARNFVERYGSGSNQNNFSNIIDAETYGTTTYNSLLNANVAQQRAALKTTPYTSTTTKALSITINALTASSANVTVGTQRQETIDRTNRTYYQDITVQVVKQGSDWKVSAATWK